jgi:hypothetical protein
VRTLVVSDFHLGVGPRGAVLEMPRPRELLLAAAEHADRLVLLGDIVEMIDRPAAWSLPVAEPLLRALGDRIGRGGEVIIVPGNHDRPLISRWLRGRSGALEVATRVPLDASPALSRLAGWLAPARVAVHYPGVWLSERVWATHGHYLGRHLLPDSSYGMARGLLGRLPRDGARPEDYELRGRPRRSRVRPRLPRLMHGVLELGRAATMPTARRHLLRPGIPPLFAPVLGFQMRRASIPALARVVHRLGIDADRVIFGHVHRLGPLPGDDPGDWYGPDGTPQLYNTGSWLYEPLLLHRAVPPHPYWPGGAIILQGDGPPRAVGLLDELAAAELHAPRRRRGR